VHRVNVTRTPSVEDYLKLLDIIASDEQSHYKSEIARILKVSPTAINKKIKRLVKYGYVREEKKSYPHLLKLTPKGVIARSRRVLTLSGYVRGREGRPKKSERPPKGMIILHNLQIMIPILKRGRPLPLKGKNPLNNWTQKFLDLPAPIPATIELTTKNIKVYAHRIYVPRGYVGYLQLSKNVTKIIMMVQSCLAQFGWIVDALSVEMPTQHIATTMPELDEFDLAPSEIYLGRNAKDVEGKENNQEARAWIDHSEKKLPNGKKVRTTEIETNDAEYAEDLQLLPKRFGLDVPFDEGLLMLPIQASRIDANIQHIGKFARSHEQFMVTFSSETLPTLNSTMNNMGQMMQDMGHLLRKIDKRLDKL
jgi:hypothetical protein